MLLDIHPQVRRAGLALATYLRLSLWPPTMGTHLGVGVTKLDGNVTLELVLETNGLDARDGANSGRLAVCDVADGTNVDLEISC